MLYPQPPRWHLERAMPCHVRLLQHLTAVAVLLPVCASNPPERA